MTQLATTILTSEVNLFIKKKEELGFQFIQLKDLSLITPSEFNLIEDLKCLILEYYSEFQILETVKETTSDLADFLEEVYEKFSKVVVDNYEQKKELVRKQLSKGSYEKIMTFLVLLFEKYEII